MDLFDYMRKNTIEQEAPLASRLRPSTLDEVVGQKHIIGKDKLLYRAIKADKLGSLIFYGPPGTGKTTLARVIANTTSARFEQLNATVAGKKDMEQVVQDAKDALGMYGKRTILFIDEIHRFNKGQQDYLLPFVEDGTILLIGATTENPYFEVNGALISRSRIFELKPLENADIRELLERALHDKEKGMGSYRAEATDEALDFLADMAYDLSVYQEYARYRSGCGSLLSSEDAGCRRGYQIYCAAYHDLCVGGCRQCGSAGDSGCGQRGAGSGADWSAGGADYPVAGGYLCGERTEEQRGVCGRR